MTTPDHFEQLRRAAQTRGERDYEREMQRARLSGEPIFCNNPYQNNHATDESTFWKLGWANAQELDEAEIAMHPMVCELIAALEPFVKFNSSNETLYLEVRSEDVTRARAVLARVKKS